MARFATSIGGDSFDPSVMDLQQGLTTAVRSGLIQYDATGLFSKDGLGNDTFRINAADGGAFFKGGLLVGSSVPAATIIGQLTDAQLAAISASKVTGQIVDSQIAAMATSKLTGQVVSAQLADLAVTTQKLADAAVQTVKIADGQVTAQKISVAQLSAISADIGTITAGIIRGAIHETSATDPKVRMDSTGVFATDSGGNQVVRLLPGSGLVLRAGGTNVLWTNPVGGATIAFAQQSGTTNPRDLSIRSKQDASGGGSAITIRSNSTTAGDSSNLVQASTNDATVVANIIRGDGSSDFAFGGSTLTPNADGTGAAGTGTKAAREDHRHPLNVDSTNPAMDGTAAPGSAATYARRDHVHPSDTSRLGVPANTGDEIRYGSGTVTWGGGNPLSQALTITHSLGRVPTAILVWYQNLAGGIVVTGSEARSPAPTSTQFTLNSRTVDGSSPANGTTTKVYWCVIG